jgi:hypothetical protein
MMSVMTPYAAVPPTTAAMNSGCRMIARSGRAPTPVLTLFSPRHYTLFRQLKRSNRMFQPMLHRQINATRFGSSRFLMCGFSTGRTEMGKIK